jgi:hypothetical protein
VQLGLKTLWQAPFLALLVSLVLRDQQQPGRCACTADSRYNVHAG